ncbi:MAG: hypothetical protein PSX71_11375 [bacterium]|nr:hypothetical protein [bacterium]
MGDVERAQDFLRRQASDYGLPEIESAPVNASDSIYQADYMQASRLWTKAQAVDPDNLLSQPAFIRKFSRISG